MTFPRVLVFLAVIMFIGAAFGVSTPVALVPVGLALWAGASLIP